MYQNKEKGFILTDVILQLLFLVLFVFILICLFPTKGFVNKIDEKQNKNQDHSVLYRQIFNDNMNSMKEAAISYYTTPRLPKNVDDKVSMTLGEMLDKKLLLPLKDKNDKSCDLKESYVEVTKLDEEYQLKINLSCFKETEYMIVHLGCYEYCEEEVCEKTNDEKAVVSTNSKETATAEKTMSERPVVNNTMINKNCVNCETSKSVEKPVYYCKYIKGAYYGRNGKVVSKNTYEKECNNKKEQILYYEYRTKTLVTETIEKQMCNYQSIETKAENIYTLAYTGGGVEDIESYPYGVKFPTGATNIKVNNILYGKENFSLTSWKNQKESKRIYNYKVDDIKWSTNDTISTTMLKQSGLSKRHFDGVKILNTKVVNYDDYTELRIDYQVNLDRKSVLLDKKVVVYNDSSRGNIYYVPIKFNITYDVLVTNPSPKECSKLTSFEKEHIEKKYIEYEEKISYQYGPVEWTTDPNLTNVEYTGNTEWR